MKRRLRDEAKGRRAALDLGTAEANSRTIAWPLLRLLDPVEPVMV